MTESVRGIVEFSSEQDRTIQISAAWIVRLDGNTMTMSPDFTPFVSLSNIVHRKYEIKIWGVFTVPDIGEIVIEEALADQGEEIIEVCSKAS